MATEIPTDGRHITVCIQRRKCGKASCNCHNGLGHGPYKYFYWKGDDGDLKNAYRGVATEEEVAEAEERRKKRTHRITP